MHARNSDITTILPTTTHILRSTYHNVPGTYWYKIPLLGMSARGVAQELKKIAQHLTEEATYR